MSIAGPRPTLAYQVEQYTDHQRQRLLMRPGITSLAGVRGRNALSWEQRIELDVEYVKGWSIWLDASVVLRTFWVLITREGQYGPQGVNLEFGERK